MNIVQKYEVPLEKLVWKADVEEFRKKLKTTKDIEPPKNPIDIVKGQTTAKETILRAIASRRNVLLLGPAGCGKSLLANTVAEQYAQKESRNVQLYDQLLVHNFLDEWTPDVLPLPTPQGTEFKEDLKDIVRELPIAISSGWSVKSDNLLDTLVVVPSRGNVGILTRARPTETYITTVHKLILGAEKHGDYTRVPDFIKKLKESQDPLATPILTHAGSTKSFSLRDIYYELSSRGPFGSLGTALKFPNLDSFVAKYKIYPKVIKYLEDMIKDIGENLDIFKESSIFDIYSGENPLMKRAELEKYMVNLIVDNSKTKGLPIQYIENPTIQNLIGDIQHDPMGLGGRKPHMRAKAGKLHKANGGIIIIDELITIFQDTFMRNYLLTVLQEKKGRIGGGHGLISGGTSAGIESEAVDADCIIIGCANEDLLQHLTPKISRRFPFKIPFDQFMENNEENRFGYAEFIKYEVEKYNNDPMNKEKVTHFSPEGIAAIVEYGVRLAQNVTHGKNKLTNILDPVGQLVITTGLIANQHKATNIEREYVQEAIKETEKIYAKLQQDRLEYIREDIIKIKTDGEEVGSVNGLVVMKDQFGLFTFGYPARVEASSSEGRSESIKSMEEEAGLAGKILKEANDIVESYLRNKFSKRKLGNIAIDFHFPQSYSEVDGDSAALTVTIALLSELSGIPVDQKYAITGSMDSRGRVQAIGGVNEKIEGFYKLCEQKGLTGTQGVIIPKDNVPDLMLKDDVLDRYRRGNFHIYQVSYIDEAIEIMMHTDTKAIEKKINEKLNIYEKNAIDLVHINAKAT